MGNGTKTRLRKQDGAKRPFNFTFVEKCKLLLCLYEVCQQMKSLFQHKHQIYLLLIILGAFALRIWGIDFGLPHIYHTDEWFEVKRALKLGVGVFDFERVAKGGYFYLLFVEYGIYYLVLKVLGIIKSGDDFLFKFFQDPTNIWLIGRTTTAIIGTLNCWFVYLLGKHTVSKSVGLFAALFMAVHLIHVQSSHYITVDVPLTCLITISFLIMCWKSSDQKFTILHYSLLGLFFALAVMTKITAAVLFFPLLFFHYTTLKSESSGLSWSSYFFDLRLICFCLVFAAVFLFGNPGIVIEWKGVFRFALSFFDFAKDQSGLDLGSTALPWPYDRRESIAQYYLNALFPWYYLFFSILTLTGLILAFRNNFSKNILFVSFIIPYIYFLLSSKSPVHVFGRYLLPIMPILYYYAAVSLTFLQKILERKLRYGRYIFIALVILCIYPLLTDTICFDTDITKPDTRTIANAWVEKNISSGSSIIIRGGFVWPSTMTVPLKIDPEFGKEVISKYFSDASMDGIKSGFYRQYFRSLEGKRGYRLIFTGNTAQLDTALSTRRVDYVIMNEGLMEAFKFPINIRTFPHLYRLVCWLGSKDFLLIKRFVPSKEIRGPRISIYKLQKNT